MAKPQPCTVKGEKMFVQSLKEENGFPRKRIYRKTLYELEEAVNKELFDRRTYGKDLAQISHLERDFICRWRKVYTIAQMEAILAGRSEESPILTVQDAANQYYAALPEASSKRHTNDLKYRLGQFSAAFGTRQIAAIKPWEISDYVIGLGKSAPNAFRTVRALYNYAIFREWVTVNPALKIKKPTATEGDKRVFRAADLTGIFAKLDGSEEMTDKAKLACRRFLVLGAFFGLRTSEIMRQKCEGISATDLHVEKMKTKAKGMRERWITIEDNQRAWIDWLKLPAKGRLMPCNYTNFRRHFNQLEEICEIEFPDNAWRRSYASHHLAAFDNADKTAARMGHTSADTTFAKYRVALSKVDGVAYFALMPA